MRATTEKVEMTGFSVISGGNCAIIAVYVDYFFQGVVIDICMLDTISYTVKQAFVSFLVVTFKKDCRVVLLSEGCLYKCGKGCR